MSKSPFLVFEVEMDSDDWRGGYPWSAGFYATVEAATEVAEKKKKTEASKYKIKEHIVRYEEKT